MANRSYLYTYHLGEDRQYRDLAEWNSKIPIAHLLLVGAAPTVCKSAIWDVEPEIAIKGDAALSRPLLLDFLEWMTPQVGSPRFKDAVIEAREMIEREDRKGSHYHLEVGEIYELEGVVPEKMASGTALIADVAEDLFNEVQRITGKPASSFADFEDEQLKGLGNSWESEFGLNFSHVLYYHLGG